ncbi:curli assembly protein CsgF [bacterium]|nr:hypothetical protein [bacterium]MDC1007335.1 curli assembly protein CsgF [bacterium]
MKKITIVTLMIGLFVAEVANAELTWGFKSPAFHYGNGYSTHVLSVEQLQFNRRKEQADEADAEARRIERELDNTTLNKFLRNVESRIYATLSKQMVDAMFAECDSTTSTCASSGTADIEGSQISWIKDGTTGEISLTVVEEDGTTTTISIPGSGEFNF